MKKSENIHELLESAWSKRREGDYKAAKGLVNKAHGLCDDRDFEVLGRIHHIYMQLESDHDHLNEALGWSRKSQAYYRKSGNLDKLAHSTRHMADLQTRMDYLNEAEENYMESISIYRAQNQTYAGNLANTLLGYGELLIKTNRIDEAKSAWTEARDLYEKINLAAGVEDMNQRLSQLPST